MSVTYTDETGREWLVRELVTYAETGRTPVGEFPAVVGSALVFESNEERRSADNAPLDWREQEGALETLFARARPPQGSHD